MKTDKALEILKRNAPVTVADTLKIELIQAALKIEKVKQYQQKLEKENPNWSDVGEAKRFNALLQEIVDIYQYQ